MNKAQAQLVFVPIPVMGHLVSTVEVAKLLLTRDHRLSITVLVLELPLTNSKVQNYVESVQEYSSTLSNRLRFIDLPKDGSELFDLSSFFERQKPNVKDAVLKITQSESSADSPRLAGAAFLGFVLYEQKIHDEAEFDAIQFKDSDTELLVPCLINPFPARSTPSAMLNKERLPYLVTQQEGLEKLRVL
ncbi:hypothetical protein GH714_019531 [Hevea brasiliensis]|uniref:Uncharacterized protein n=1 Tax=Hevea brasiliensis TaxID=3981 RepID=A0A6A6N333_HEVBR|nr:hypothetical protein GH714_019531 [Hevea brasiliensis]